MDLQEAFDQGFEAVKAYVDAEVCALSNRIFALELGPTEGRGQQGGPGPAGPKGDPGRDGRDAADLAMLKDWMTEQVVTGIESVLKAMKVTSPDNGRTLQFGWAETVHEIKTAIPIDAGVWVDRTYAAGDAVSHGGSLFIAQAATTAKPGKSDDWRLAVKRGSDGRDYREEKRQPEPVRLK